MQNSAISEFPKWRKYLISLSFRDKSSVRPVQVGGFEANIVVHRSTAVRGRGGPPPPWESSCRTRTGPVEADGTVDAQNAPTAPSKTLRVFHELPQGLSHRITHAKPRKAPKWRWETRIDPRIRSRLQGPRRSPFISWSFRNRSSKPPPVENRIPQLPCDQLSWRDFERLVFRLARKNPDVVYCARYGRPGQAQDGIDVYARLSWRWTYLLAGQESEGRGRFRHREGCRRLPEAANGLHRRSTSSFASAQGLADTGLQDMIEAQAAAAP